MLTEDTYESLTPGDSSAYEEFYRIYAESMPLRERKPAAEIAAMVARPDYKILLVKKEDQTIGFSVIFVPIDHAFALLEYMAIHSDFRSAGVGGGLFRHSLELVVSGRGEIPMLLEVDSDRESSADRVIRQKRKNFYRRLGCLQIDGLHYLLPLRGDGPPPEMDLMVHIHDSLLPIRKSQLERWLSVIYERVYNCSPDDPRIAAMMKSVTDPVGLL